ncbi:hypothetical protein TI10_14195 [Photorhabdus luminescens subsp. luminescens]|uniref:Uncharacterized protein n=2 Tax=Morganellaceae TaxID=1903414 RepID=A0A1G5QEY0_PHOLU|nr:hypothetical protein TI10_14195 [Photorhabdus luminescens subsp. luminescens]SCZ60354.1 hypothetical protein SAMN02982990_01587 [Photorhabdus luminescens]
MNTEKTFINRVKQNVGRNRRWSTWVMCASIGALFSTSVLAVTECPKEPVKDLGYPATPPWDPEVLFKALGQPIINGKDNQGKPVHYPARGSTNLVGVFPPVVDYDFPTPTGELMLKDAMFWVRAQNRIFKVPHAVTGMYHCKMIAKRKDGAPGRATANLYTDAIVPNRDIYWFKGDQNVMESSVTDLVYTATCKGAGFSWERKPDEKFEWESKWENGVPSIEMQDNCHWIHNVAFWTPPDDNPNDKFKDPAVLRPTSAENANPKKSVSQDNPDNLPWKRKADSNNQ